LGFNFCFFFLFFLVASFGALSLCEFLLETFLEFLHLEIVEVRKRSKNETYYLCDAQRPSAGKANDQKQKQIKANPLSLREVFES